MLFCGVGGCGVGDVCCIVHRNWYVWIEFECGDNGFSGTCQVLVRICACRLRVQSCLVEGVETGVWWIIGVNFEEWGVRLRWRSR